MVGNKVYQATTSVTADFAVSAEVSSQGTAQPQPVLKDTDVTATTTVATVDGSGTTTATVATSSGTATVTIPVVQGMTAQQYVQAVEQVTDRPFTSQVTVTVAQGGYQPEPGTLAAQDQYAYDVTNFWLTYRETGNAPAGWTIGKDALGNTILTSPNGNSLVGHFEGIAFGKPEGGGS